MFIWTLHDVIGLFFLGLMLLVGLFIGAWMAVDSLVRKFRRWRARRAA